MLPNFSNEVPLPLLRAFMDDLNLLSSVQRAHTLLQHCTTALKWAGLEFKADKSRSIVIIKGSSMNTTLFSVAPSSDPSVYLSFISSIYTQQVKFLGQIIDGSLMDRKSVASSDLSVYSSFIPSVCTQQVKFLGGIIDGSLTDRKSIEELAAKLLSGLKIIDGSYFSGNQKLWIMQYLLILRIQWPLLIYEIPMPLAARLEQKISTFICKWLYLHHSMSSLCFYSADSPCPLPVKSLTSVLKASKISGYLLLKHSLVSSCPSKLKAGSWEVEKVLNVAELDIKLLQMTGYHHQGHHGIGYINTPKAPEEKSTKQDFISRSFKEIDEIYIEHFVSSSTSTPGTVDEVVELHPAGFLMEVFACISHQPFFVSLQLWILYHHQVTSNAGESPLKPPVFCATKPFAQPHTF